MGSGIACFFTRVQKSTPPLSLQKSNRRSVGSHVVYTDTSDGDVQYSYRKLEGEDEVRNQTVFDGCVDGGAEKPINKVST